jgi:hypothetical protein
MNRSKTIPKPALNLIEPSSGKSSAARIAPRPCSHLIEPEIIAEWKQTKPGIWIQLADQEPAQSPSRTTAG